MTNFGKQDTEKPVNLQDKSYWYLLIILSETTKLRGKKQPQNTIWIAKILRLVILIYCENTFLLLQDFLVHKISGWFGAAYFHG